MQLKELIEIKKKHVYALAEKRGVQVIDIGFKVVDGKETQELCIRVGVKEKLPLDEIKSEDLVEKKLNGAKTDVIEVDEIVALSAPHVWRTIAKEVQGTVDRLARHRPVYCGSCAGNIKITSATCGGVVVATEAAEAIADSVDWCVDANASFPAGSLYWHSNPHCWCEDPRKDVSKQERRIVQPGVLDGGKVERDKIGILVSHKRINEYPEPNFCQGAICKPDNEAWVNAEILEIGVPSEVIPRENLKLGTMCVCSGREPGITRGKLTGLDTSTVVRYPWKAIFHNQLSFEGTLMHPGKSGSWIFIDGTRKLVASGFAGSRKISIATYIMDSMPIGMRPLTKKDEPKPKSFMKRLTELIQKIILLIKEFVTGSDVKMVGIKKWWKSKTLWVNALAMAALVLQYQYGFMVGAEEQVAVVTLVNMFLRFFTDTELEG